MQKFSCYTLISLISILSLAGQNQIVLNNDVFVVIDNAAFLVIENANPNALTTSGTGGNIISESEVDVIQWEIGLNTGTYTVPFTTNSGTKIPLVINKTTSGTGVNAEFILSTWECATDMNNPWPSGISNMNFNGVDKSLFVADRYWHIDALSYVNKPDITMTMNYDPAANEIGGSNSIIESNLMAQRFNTTLNHWEATNLFGINDANNDRVISISVPGTDFFEDWILVDFSNPLPVSLTNFEVNCEENDIHLKWQTETEINNDYFSVEKSYDGLNFFELTKVQGSGNSSSPINYSFLDDDHYDGIIYYRLKQVDYDGASTYHDIEAISCYTSHFNISNIHLGNNQLNFKITSSYEDALTVMLHDYTGRLIAQKKIQMHKGAELFALNNLQLSTGMYLLTVNGKHGSESHKLTTIRH